MQNKWNSTNEADFVNLNARGCGCAEGWCADGAWLCGRCGCANRGCDGCARCGCQGGVVRATEKTARADCACAETASRERRGNCDDCPASFTTGHRVQCCPENTRIRRDCGCSDACPANRNRSNDRCGCEEECPVNRNRSGDKCGCQDECPANRNCSGDKCGCEDNSDAYQRRNAGVGIVHAVKQKLADVFESESALRTGTLFPELHKPMNGRCPGCSNCSTCEQQSAFAAWDLRLYLNTHPEDQEALALFRRLCSEAEDPNYATTFLDDEGCGSCWGWTDGPWPWECQKCGD